MARRKDSVVQHGRFYGVHDDDENGAPIGNPRRLFHTQAEADALDTLLKAVTSKGAPMIRPPVNPEKGGK